MFGETTPSVKTVETNVFSDGEWTSVELVGGGHLAMTNSTHISVETLANIVEDRATSVARETAMTHLTTCASCSGALRRLQQLIHMMRSDSTNEVPRDVLVAAINIFSQERRVPLRRIVALLTFDSSNAGPAFSVRSLPAGSRQMIYSAEEVDVELRITVQNDECILAGQVIGEGCADGHVEVSGASGKSKATLNDVCEFTLPPIPPGNYSLTVRMLDREIEIPELELKV